VTFGVNIGCLERSEYSHTDSLKESLQKIFIIVREPTRKIPFFGHTANPKTQNTVTLYHLVKGGKGDEIIQIVISVSFQPTRIPTVYPLRSNCTVKSFGFNWTCVAQVHGGAVASTARVPMTNAEGAISKKKKKKHLNSTFSKLRNRVQFGFLIVFARNTFKTI